MGTYQQGQLRLSATEAVILRLLFEERGRYGLEMVKASAGALKRGTVYVLLDRLEDKGFVVSRREAEGEAGTIPRRLYKITGMGQRALAGAEAAAHAYAATFAGT